MESGLKNCPFCGGKSEIIIDTDDDGRFAAVTCPKCGAGSRQHYFCGDDARDYAASAWNTRAPSDAALVEALRNIAFLRPGGPTSNKLAMQMERIAIDALDAIADVVLRYRPKPVSDAAKDRKKRAKKVAKARAE